MEVMLFSEDQGRAVVTCDEASVATVSAVANEHGVPAQRVGRTGGSRLDIGAGVDLSLAELQAAWEPTA